MATNLRFVDQPDLRSDIAEGAVVVAIEAVGPAAERDEVIEVAVVVDIGPGIRLSADGAEQFRLDQLEALDATQPAE